MTETAVVHVLWLSSNAGNSARCAIYFNLTGKKMPPGTCAASIWKMQRCWTYGGLYKNVRFGTMISASARPKESWVLVCLLMNGQVQSLQSLWITWRSQNAQSSETHVVLFSCFFVRVHPGCDFYLWSSSCVWRTHLTLLMFGPECLRSEATDRRSLVGTDGAADGLWWGPWPKTQIACCSHAAMW